MTNTERQKQLDEKRIKEFGDITACGCSDYCDYCKEENVGDSDCCAKAYNRMKKEASTPAKPA